MASKDFNTSMDSYIENIRGKKNNFSIAKNKEDKIEEKVPSNISTDSVYIIKKPKTFLEKLKETFTTTDEESFEERKKEDFTKTSAEEQEFEQEFEEIKTEENKEGFFSWLKSIFSSDVNETYAELDKIPEEDVQKVIKENRINFSQKNISDNNYSSNEIPQKTGFFSKMLNKIGISIDDSEDDYEEYEKSQEQKKTDINSIEEFVALREDLKEIAVIATTAFKKLPKEQFKLFKESQDFSKFKTILKKHGIIKEKSE